MGPTMGFSRKRLSGRSTVESHESRNGANDDFLEPAQSLLSICLNCGDLAFFVPSLVSPFALAPFRLS